MGDIHATIFRAPIVESGVAHAVLAAQLRDRDATLDFFQNSDNLTFAVSGSFHVDSTAFAILVNSTFERYSFGG
jgi:hypothetical protein